MAIFRYVKLFRVKLLLFSLIPIIFNMFWCQLDTINDRFIIQLLHCRNRTLPWVKVFRIDPDSRILRLTFHRKSASKC